MHRQATNFKPALLPLACTCRSDHRNRLSTRGFRDSHHSSHRNRHHSPTAALTLPLSKPLTIPHPEPIAIAIANPSQRYSPLRLLPSLLCRLRKLRSILHLTGIRMHLRPIRFTVARSLRVFGRQGLDSFLRNIWHCT
jgi:hypothetical protein